MFNQIIAMTIKELKVIFHDRGEVVGLFLMPIAFILVMTTALQSAFGAGSSSNPVSLLVVSQDKGEISSKVIADLRGLDGLTVIEQYEGQALTRSMTEDLIVAHKYSLAVVFPADFSEQVLASGLDNHEAASTVSFVIDPTIENQLLSPVRGTVQGFIEREASIAQAPEKAQAGIEQLAATLPASQIPLLKAMSSQFVKLAFSNEASKTSSLGVAYQ